MKLGRFAAVFSNMTIRKHILAVLLFSVSLPCLTRAQNWSFGALVGGSYYLGDVVNEVDLRNVRWSLMGFARYHVNTKVAIRANLAYARVLGLDSIASDAFKRDRNLNFYSDIMELSGQVEYNLLKDRTRGRRIRNRVIPYVFAGIGLCYFTPKTVYNGTTYNLASAQTSGIAYSQLAFAFPIGLGVRCYLTPKWQLGFEFGPRFTNTSDIDDIRGGSVYPNPSDLPSDGRIAYDRSSFPKDPDTGIGFGVPGKERAKPRSMTDVYFIYGITISYKMSIGGGNHYWGSAVRCPRFF